jgi:hypothetical protein
MIKLVRLKTVAGKEAGFGAGDEDGKEEASPAAAAEAHGGAARRRTRRSDGRRAAVIAAAGLTRQPEAARATSAAGIGLSVGFQARACARCGREKLKAEEGRRGALLPPPFFFRLWYVKPIGKGAVGRTGEVRIKLRGKYGRPSKERSRHR